MQPQSHHQQPRAPDVILQTLPDVVTSFLESPPASNDGCGNGPTTPNSVISSSCAAADNDQDSTKIKSEHPVPTELSNLGDLDSLNDLLGMSDKTMPASSDLMDTFAVAEKLDCTWESGSSSSSGSHFEFPCTQDMLGDIGVNEPVDYWGSVDDIMIRI